MAHQNDNQLIAGLLIGHAEHAVARTGLTVALTPSGATGGVAVRGGAPGTRETDLLRDENLVDRVNAILLTGGSAFGLAAADGVVRWLRERGYGWPTSAGSVPIVPGAVLFDLPMLDRVDDIVWPDAAMGYRACEAATAAWPVEGRVGAGRGATVGKILGTRSSSPGGVGVATRRLPNGVTVGALTVVNAFGHVVDPGTNQILAGPRLPDGTFGDTVEILLNAPGSTQPPVTAAPNTTLGVIWTDAPLTKTACNRIANVAHNGLARTIRPVHTQADGDTLFVLSLAAPASRSTDLTVLCVAATEVVTEAVIRAVR